jgi:hypothetical protein
MDETTVDTGSTQSIGVYFMNQEFDLCGIFSTIEEQDAEELVQ